MDAHRLGFVAAAVLGAAALSGCSVPRLQQAGLVSDGCPSHIQEPCGGKDHIPQASRGPNHIPQCDEPRHLPQIDDSHPIIVHPCTPAPCRPVPCSEPPAPPAPPCDPCAPPQRSQACGQPCPLPPAPSPCGLLGVDDYVPMVPVADNRAAITTLVLSPSPWLGTEGDPLTPERGRVAFRLQRIEDERTFSDRGGNVFVSDGEIQEVSLEYVSPRIALQPSACGGCVAFHLAGSIHAFSLDTAWFDGLRNWVENDVAHADSVVRAMHDRGGRELSVNGDDMLQSVLWKAKGAIKFPLPDVGLAGTRLQSAFSVGVTSPAFGPDDRSGNRGAQADATLAFAVPFTHSVRVVGGAAALFTSESPRYKDLGIDTESVLGIARVGLEWWVTPRFGAMIGASWNGHYTTGTGMPTDKDSYYVDFGLIWRVSPRVDVHLFGSENPDPKIVTATGGDFSQSQKDADFTIAAGVGISL